MRRAGQARLLIRNAEGKYLLKPDLHRQRCKPIETGILEVQRGFARGTGHV